MSATPTKVSLDFLKRTVEQANRVEALAETAKRSKSDADLQRLEIEMEALAFYQNAGRGNPKNRARAVIDIARSTVLGRAVTQPLPRLDRK